MAAAYTALQTKHYLFPCLKESPMSSLTGHYRITAAAVQELPNEMKSHPLATGLQTGYLPVAAVARDILDVVCLGHWADFGQKHHFMRQFDSQSPYEAYRASVNWIYENALDAAQAIAARVAAHYPKGLHKAKNPQHAGWMVFYDLPLQSLGNAVHALEDSFSPSHVVRGLGAPGPITHVKRYSGAEKDHHEEGDDQWRTDNVFSITGRLAVEAVKALLKMVIQTATFSSKPQALVNWHGFRDKWLRADPKLSRAADRVAKLIERYYAGVRVGATNVKTFNMDEEGLANALLKESSRMTLAVFARLDEQYNSDADDVAEIYVNLVRKEGGSKLAALRQNKPLIQRLIKVMDEGWTSSGENKNIQFLKHLL